MNRAEIGQRIRTMRRRRRLRQKDLAKLAGVSTASMCYYEKGHMAIPEHKLVAIARALDVTVEEIFRKRRGDVKALAARLLSKREESELTQAEVAELVGISPSLLSRYEHAGVDMPSLQVIVDLADLYDVSVDWLATGREFQGSIKHRLLKEKVETLQERLDRIRELASEEE